MERELTIGETDSNTWEPLKLDLRDKTCVKCCRTYGLASFFFSLLPDLSRRGWGRAKCWEARARALKKHTLILWLWRSSFSYSLSLSLSLSSLFCFSLSLLLSISLCLPTQWPSLEICWRQLNLTCYSPPPSKSLSFSSCTHTRTHTETHRWKKEKQLT